MPIPFDQIPVGEGRLPDGTFAPFFVDRREYDILIDDGPRWKAEDARFIPEAVADPDAIFVGLRRANQAESLCYSVSPTRDPDDDADDFGPAPPPVFGRVFVAFASLCDMGYVVWDWEWREQGDAEPGHPENWQTDFEGRVWHRE
jgi:hypothetical protein